MDVTAGLPRRGPFQLKAGALWRGTAGMVLLGLFLVAVGVGFFGWGGYLLQEVVRVREVWNTAEVVDAEPQFEGEVTTRNLVFNEYELSVTYTHPSAGLTTFEADFFTFFTGPDEADPVEVKALSADPQQAVLNWQADAWVHGTVWALFVVALGLAAGAGGAAIVFTAVTQHLLVQELAREGQLVAGEIRGVKHAVNDGTVTITLDVLVQGTSHALSFQQGTADPHFLDERTVVVLASVDGRKAYLPKADGSPLQLD